MNEKKKRKPQVIKKPIYQGKIVEKSVIKRGLKVFGSLVLVTVLYMIFGPMFMVDSFILRLLFNTVLILIASGLLMMTGTSDGESDAALGEIVYLRKEEGKSSNIDEENRSFHPLKGFFIAYLGASVFFILAVVLAVFTKEQPYTLGVLPSWAQGYTVDSPIGQGLAYYSIERGIQWLDVVRMIVRASVLPIFSVFESGSSGLLLERLTPLFVLIVPTGYALGYLRGKKIRAMIHSNIAQSKKKKRKKKKKVQKTKEPERLA